ncbi:MAG: phosphatidylserine decarboxylase [Planctomycetota bacterium]|nr:phosphatidylserine decarboxylase [Planctomycetota bacterium]
MVLSIFHSPLGDGMRDTEYAPVPLEAVPLPSHIRSVQPGGGICYRIELLWGKLRRWYLIRFRKGYVAKMAARRSGSTDGAPHPVLDPRDLKYCRNQCTCDWKAEDDPFSWRDRIPLARWGLAETLIMGIVSLLLAGLPLLAGLEYWPGALPGLVLFIWILSFFRDPHRVVPTDPGLLVAPADGKIVEIAYLDEDPFIEQPAIRIGIFLSIFNVHINRSPCDSQVVELRYAPGLFLDARNPESAMKNENMWIGLQEAAAPYRRFCVGQISGLFARRIVCGLRPGETVARGQSFGMIKLGSRTELIIPQEEGLELQVRVGQKVTAGSTTIARYAVDT